MPAVLPRVAGFELSLIEESYNSIQEGGVDLAQQGWETSPFLVFLKSIPGRRALGPQIIALLCLVLS